jgi:cytochrome c peroxidase
MFGLGSHVSAARRGASLLALLAIAGCAGASSFVRASGPTIAAEVALGKTLFFDTRLSSNDQMSCATCHEPERGFTDGKRFSTGTTGTVLSRHTPHLFNLAENTSFFRDGRATSLQEQARMVIENPDELDNDLGALTSTLSSLPYYRDAFEFVYPGRGVEPNTITRAIASFVASIRADDTPFDRFAAGDATALDEAAKRGKDIFFGSASCVECHSGPDFSDDRFHNTGVLGEDRGRAALDRGGDFADRPYPFFQTHKAFKTPGLKNVALTAPYFHDGSEQTLEDVVRFYNDGGREYISAATSPEIRPLGLSDREIGDIVAFLRALTAPVDFEIQRIPSAEDHFEPKDFELDASGSREPR